MVPFWLTWMAMAFSDHTITGLESIKEFLIRLDLDPSRIPTPKEYKKASRG